MNDRALPPQNVEAEESILGGILLDPEAMGRVADILTPEAFYLKDHQEIFEAALDLHRQRLPTDLMTVTSWLSDRDRLDKIGGTSKLAQLIDRTVTAVNIDRYAALVMDKYMRRQLIAAGHDIVDLGFDTATELERVLDQAEQKVFNLTQKRPQQGLTPISETLVQTIEELDNRQQNAVLPGLNSDFYDLDAMTSGFQRSDLIILAGRPSMGKTALGLGIALNIAKIHSLPVAIFSLEMSKEQLVQRMLASEAEIDSNRLRSGKLAQNDLEPLSRAMGTLSELPIFIDDSSNVTVMQMRSQVRRLQAEQGGKLGLVLLDYLQLMEGGGDNRVQELAKITRSLKGMAREANAPVIALSQLSRGVEARNNKRPMMSDLRESGCLSGDSLVLLADTNQPVPIRDLVGRSGFAVWAMNERTMKLERATVSHAFATGVKPVFCLKTRLGRTIRATGNHKFRTFTGWQRLDRLSQGDRIAISQRELAAINTSIYRQNVSRDRGSKLATIVESEPLSILANSDLYWDEIVEIVPDGETEVYDLTVPQHHNFVANNIVVHNSIEQDADLIIMLYRDAYYNPDSPDRDTAEAIITKHRNGPTGIVKLNFAPEYTKFRNAIRQHEY